MQKLVTEVIECLKNSRQRLCWTNTIVTPVRKIVPASPRCENLRVVMEILEDQHVIEYCTGFMSLSKQPPFWVPTSFCLTQDFFDKYCTVYEADFKSYQLSLFN